MRWYILLLCLWVGIGSATAQKADLTLSDAIMQQWRKYYPKRLNNLQWVPEQKKFTYLNDTYDTLWIQSVKDKDPSVFFTLDDMGAALSQGLEHIAPIRWESQDMISLKYKNKVYFLVVNKKGELSESHTVEVPSSENQDFHRESRRIAFTQQNNLYVLNENGGKVEVFQTKDKSIVSGQAIARHEFGISKGTFWSPNGNKLAFYQKDESDVYDYPLLDITATPGKLKTIKYPMAGQPSEYAKVGVFDMDSKSLLFLHIKGPKDQYLTNLAWGPEGKFIYLAVVNREQNEMKLQKYEAISGELVKTLFEEKHDKYVEPENPVWFLPNNKKEFLWQSERDGFNHLYRYNTEGELLGQVTKGDWVVLDILGLDAKGKSVLVKGTDKSGLNTTLYSADLKTGEVTQLIKKEGQHTIKPSSDKKYFIDIYSNLETPAVTRILDKKGEEVMTLLEAPNPMSNVTYGQSEFVTLQAEDGTPLHGRLIKPADFDPTKKYPVIVYVYGGPHAQLVTNRWLGGASLWMHYAANQGYLVFTLDNRGSANRGFDFENCIHRQLSKLEMKDQLVGVEHLKSLDYVDADRMAVHGWSYGGFMTTSLMLKYPETFKVGVAGGPVTDWKYYEVMYGERYMDMPTENPEGYKETALKNHAKNLKGDLLLIHGTVDNVVVMQHNLTLVKAFVDAGILIDFFPYPMHPHNVRGKDRVHLMKKVLTYIDDKLNKE